MRFFVHILIAFSVLIASFGNTLLPISMAQEIYTEQYSTGKVTEVKPDTSPIIGASEEQQTLNVELDTQETVEVYQAVNTANKASESAYEGETIILHGIDTEDGSVLWQYFDRYRLPQLLIVCLFFLITTSWCIGRRIIGAFLGLIINGVGIFGGILPLIAAGYDPILVTFPIIIVMSTLSLYLAHGWNAISHAAVKSISITLLIVFIITWLSLGFTRLSGVSGEEAFLLQLSEYSSIHLKGLLLSGILIGTLGVLDDIAVGQSAAIAEIFLANPKFNFKELHDRGFRVGQEHIISLINTLALAYAGSALPILLLLTLYNQPWWVLLNSEFLGEEIIRTLMGSFGLVLTVPITTWIAARQFINYPPEKNLHHHHHHH